MSVEMLCIAGVDGYFKQLNPAWDEGPRLDASTELMARPFAEFVHPDDRNVTGSEQQRLRLGGGGDGLREPLPGQGRLLPLALLARDLRPSSAG